MVDWFRCIVVLCRGGVGIVFVSVCFCIACMHFIYFCFCDVRFVVDGVVGVVWV